MKPPAKAVIFVTAFMITVLNACLAWAGPNTNIQVESSTDLSAYFNEITERPEKGLTLFGDEVTSVGIDGDGNPNLNTRF